MCKADFAYFVLRPALLAAVVGAHALGPVSDKQVLAALLLTIPIVLTAVAMKRA